MKDTITKNSLAKSVFYQTGIPATLALEVIDSIFANIIEHAVNDGSVKIPKFGSFYVKDKAERMGRNLNTNKDAIIKARKVVSFRPSTQLKQAVNVSEKN